MKKTTSPEEERSPSHGHDTSAAAQRVRLLERLRLGPVDTITARRELNIMAPAPRVKELREAGYPIHTHLIRLNDDQGRPHRRVAQYYLGTVQQLSQE
ncbi:helix-turn-helix domain-containing protein [Pseudomonas sp. D(2018)]|uniref:helix-turn-helix domain-containing protein n=1 Tax=Pseudomonas sp. D(2018) TaxID=2502238 RepID=UPI0010F9F747|nr:helix-turn-helix domain-containing protein [Pseudomonas sp. D(2018)]